MQWFMPAVLAGLVVPCGTESAGAAPLGTTGLAARYSYAGDGQLPGSVVKAFTIALGQVEEDGDTPRQWLRLSAEKTNGESFCVWVGACLRLPAANRNGGTQNCVTLPASSWVGPTSRVPESIHRRGSASKTGCVESPVSKTDDG